MSHDARNSVYLWVGGIVFALLFWAALHFDPLGNVPVNWIWALVAVSGLINIAMFVRGMWLRRNRAGKPDSNG